MTYIIEQHKNNGIYLVEVKQETEYSYTFSVGKTHYFRRYKNKERLKVLKEMYSMSRLKVIEDKINEYKQLKLF